ncbi:MAG: response regulator [Sneathiella sp.]|nr:response regulator [Sneathiella sp.]
MFDPRYQSSSVLLYDPQPSLRHNTRAALLAIGFGVVDAVNYRKEFLERLSDGTYDLVIGDMVTKEGNLNSLVRKMRANDIGSNPFVNIIITLWNTSPESVAEGIQAGADDLLSRPMSAAQIAGRVQGLLDSRKPFIVTEDYMGPERRQIVRGLATGSSMIVPNSLKAKVENKPDLDATPDNIRLALAAVNDRKVTIFTEQFLRQSTKILSMGPSLTDVEERHLLVRQMMGMNEELVRRISGTEYAHTQALCEAFFGVLDRIHASTSAISEKDRDLLYQIPFAIHKACKEVRVSANLAFDIEYVSSKLNETGTK